MARKTIGDLDPGTTLLGTTLFETEQVAGPTSEKFTIDQLMAYSGGVLLNAGNIVIVDAVNGDNSTGARGTLYFSFATLSAAKTAAAAGDLIIVRPGVHSTAGNLGKDQVNWHFMRGALTYSTGTIWTGNGITYNVGGEGWFRTSSGWFAYMIASECTFTAAYARANATNAGILYAEGGHYECRIDDFFTNYDGFVLDTSTGHDIGLDYLHVTSITGRTNHTGFATIQGGAQDCLIVARVNRFTVGWTNLGGGWCGFNVGGRIEFYGTIVREESVPDESGAWFYAHGAANAGASFYFSGRTELLCTDGANWSEMRYGFRCDSYNDFIFELTPGSYLHCHSFLDPTSSTIFWSQDCAGELRLYGTLDQNGDSGSSGHCIHFMNSVTWPVVEFRGCDMKQSGGYSTDTVYLNSGATTYVGKLLFRDGPFPVSFTNSITGLEVDY